VALTDPETESSKDLLHTCWEAKKHREYYIQCWQYSLSSCGNVFMWKVFQLFLRWPKTWCWNSMSS